MSLSALGFFAVACLHLFLAYYVLRANRHSPANITFAGLALTVSIWTVVLTFTHHSSAHSLLFSRLTFFVGTFMPLAFVLFVISSSEAKVSFIAVQLPIYIVAVQFAALTLTQLVVVTALSSRGRLALTYGPAYPLWLSYVVTYLAGGFLLLTKAYWSASGILRFRLYYILLGLTFPIVGIIATNLVFPFAFGLSHVGYYGPVFSVPFLLCTTHALVRHRFLDVTLVLKESVAWIAAIFVALMPILAACMLFWTFFAARLSYVELCFIVASAVGVGLLIIFLREAASKWLDYLFYRRRANFQKVVRTASAWLTTVLNVEVLLRLIADTIVDSLLLNIAAIYLKKNTGEWYIAVHSATRRPDIQTDARAGPISQLIEEWAHTKSPVALGSCDTSHPAFTLLVPIVFDDAVIGAIALGTKLSGDPFYTHDVELLSTLSNQAGVAIRNAQLYEQVALINEYLRNIVATIESGVVAVNEAEQVTMFNNAAERLAGLASEEIVGQPLSELPSAIADSLRTTLASGLPRVVPDVELVQVAASRSVPVICCTSPLRGPTGVLVGAVAVFSDLTALKQLETERQRAERLAYFETLAAGIAHEIKNPLVAIKTFLQLLPRRFGDPQFREEFGRVASREIGRMDHLVARLQSLAKPGGRTHHPVDLRLPVTEALELLKPRLEEKQIATEWMPGADPCPVMGDHAELEQLFLNLFINALEAMSPGGVLTIRVSGRGATATVEVDDTGPGIREDVAARIFDPFVTTKLHGSGLGLAICSSITDAHRGRLRATNKPGGTGALFTVELPLGTQVAMSLNA